MAINTCSFIKNPKGDLIESDIILRMTCISITAFISEPFNLHTWSDRQKFIKDVDSHG